MQNIEQNNKNKQVATVCITAKHELFNHICQVAPSDILVVKLILVLVYISLFNQYFYFI